MKKIVCIIAIMLNYSLSAFSQATSLTVDCQNPGWLSNLITYSEQQTIRNLKVTGYINGDDLNFIKTLVNKRSLNGIIDLEDVFLVAGGKIKKDNNWSYFNFYSIPNRSIQKFVYPKFLEQGGGLAHPFYYNGKGIDVDTVVWTQPSFSQLDVSNLGPAKFYSLPDGIKKTRNLPDNAKVVLPSSVDSIFGNPGKDLIVYSFIEEPKSVYAKYELYSSSTGTRYYASFWNSTIYIPKGTLDKYLNSDFSLLRQFVDWQTTKPSNNVFIEYYDLDSVIVSSPHITLYTGGTDSIKTTIYPDAELVSYINYYNSNPSVASVNSDGEVTAMNCGETEITITPNVFIDGLETKSTNCLIKVFDHTEGVEIDSVEYIHIGEHITIGARTLPLGTSDNQIILTSSNDDVITINEKGELVGVGKGTCIITATSVDGKYTAQCEVTVLKAVEDVSLEIHQISMNPEESRRLLANVSPYDADNKKVNWTSSDSSVATVDESGTVTAVNSGEAWIKAVSDDNPEACDSCKVTVTKAVSGIELDITECTLNKIGQTIQLTAKVLPENATNKNVNWKSSNENVCFVSNGKVVAVGFGTAVVIATTEEGGYMAICTVKVEEASTLKGDVNTDGKVDISDVVAVINTMAGDTTFKATSDVNNDGKTDISDVVSVINIMAGSSE